MGKYISLKDWDEEYREDSDVKCEKGWRVYCEDWGHVEGDSFAYLCIQPAYMWYGK